MSDADAAEFDNAIGGNLRPTTQEIRTPDTRRMGAAELCAAPDQRLGFPAGTTSE